jgi:co-chaperonin GroES (HSP10)
LADRVVQIVGDIDWVYVGALQSRLEDAPWFVAPYPGRTVVEMLPVAQSSSGVLIAGMEDAEWRLRSDVGMVIDVGDGVALIPGDVVLVDHSHGKRVSGFYSGKYESLDEVRFYGCVAVTGRKAKRVPWYRSILARLIKTDDDFDIVATHDNVIVNRGDIIEKTESGVYLPDSHTFRETRGVVVSVGPAADPEIRVGDTVVYMANLMYPVKGLMGIGEGGAKTPKNYGIIPSAGILCKVVP